MRFFIQILFLLFTWFNLSATLALTKVALPSHAVSFPKTENQKLESELKIGVSNFARSGISENSFSQKTIVWASYFLENRARAVNVGVVNTAGNLIDDALALTLKSHPNFSKLGLSINELDDFKALLNTKMPNSASDIFGGLKSHLDAGTSFENMQQMISGLKNNWGF